MMRYENEDVWRRWVGARMDAIALVLLAVSVIVAMAAKSLMSASLLALALTHLLQLSGSMQVRLLLLVYRAACVHVMQPQSCILRACVLQLCSDFLVPCKTTSPCSSQ